jgi:hypothetical protein
VAKMTKYFENVLKEIEIFMQKHYEKEWAEYKKRKNK